ncbi:MAG TPA: hypothetical protein G4N97_04500 [Thermoflexia bacterium]|nr:hypothetical protein [Thermoflexia bacterium]
MNTQIRSDATAHSTREGDTYLLNYRLLIKDLPELASWWPSMDDEERLHHRLAFSQTWEMRAQLGALYRAGRLSPKQEAELAALDDELLRHLDEANLCYGLDLQGVAQIFVWGTPLAQSDEIIYIPIRPRRLGAIAPALIGASGRMAA